MGEEVRLESRGNGRLKLLNTLVGAATAVAIHLAEGRNVELGLDEGGSRISLTTAVGVVREDIENAQA